MLQGRAVAPSAKRCHLPGRAWGSQASEGRLLSLNTKDTGDVGFSGSWGPTDQTIGHRDGFTLVRSETYLPRKTNQRTSKSVWKAKHHLTAVSYHGHSACVCGMPVIYVRGKVTTRCGLGHRGPKPWAVTGDARHGRETKTQISVGSSIW